MFSKVLCAIGLGPREKAEHIIRRASQLVDDDGKITLLHIVETGGRSMGQTFPSAEEVGRLRETENTLRSLCARLGVEAAVIARFGHPAALVMEVAKEEKADLIIVGSHVQDITDAFFGSVVDRITRGATCSVLVDRH